MNIRSPENRLGYSIGEFCKAVPIGRTKLYAEARAGNIRLRKIGTKTVITMQDALEYMRSLPHAEMSAAQSPKEKCEDTRQCLRDTQ